MSSRPVAIPTARTSAVAVSQAGRHNEERRLYFGLIDIPENGEASWLLSDGSGRFAQLRPCEPVPPLVFIIERRRNARHFIIEILTPSLQRVIRGVLGRTDIPGSTLKLDITTLMAYYGRLKEQHNTLQQKSSQYLDKAELELLLRGCLLDWSLYHGMDASLHRKFTGPGGRAYLQDTLHQKLLSGFDELDDCFRLGLLTEEETALEVSVFNHRFEQLAYAGNLCALQEHMEPAVRSGEVEVQHDHAFLTNVLANGHIMTHQYLIDLSQRTSSNSIQTPNMEGQDISTDPMYEAIKQGLLQNAKLCILNRQHFSGTLFQDQGRPPLTDVTPLVAAVFWEQIDIVRLLLDAGPPYLEGWTQAMSWASSEILPIMREFEKQHMGLLHHTQMSNSPNFDHSLAPTHVEMPPQQHLTPGRSSQGPSRSVSEIANRIAGLRWNEGLIQFSQPSIFSPGASLSTTATSPWEAGTLRSNSQTGATSAYHVTQPSSAERYRMKIGRVIAGKIEGSCERLQSALSASPWGSPGLLSCFSSAKRVWQAGLSSIRQLLRNEIPSSVTEVIQLLLVVDALSSLGLESDQSCDARDFDRWRTAVTSPEQPLFDELVRLAFGNSSSSGWPPSGDIHELWRVQELAQNLVSMSSSDLTKTERSSIRGLRLPFIYGCHHLWRRVDQHRKQHFALSNHHTGTEKAEEPFELETWAGRSAAEDFDLFDFIKAEVVQDEHKTSPLMIDRPEHSEKDASWKSIAPTIVLLLGSQEFSVILCAIKRVQLPKGNGNYASTNERVLASFSATSKALERLEEFCSITQLSTTEHTLESLPPTPLDGPYVSLIPTMKAWIQGGFTSEGKLSQSLDPYVLQRGTGSRALSAGDMEIASSLSSSVPSTRPSKPLDRLRCQSLGCPKTFSNVSNRNKHMREGCAFRENPGYRCRNEGCSKTLTTKWYRSTHETTRCRYRTLMIGLGSPPISEDSLMGGVSGV